MKRKSPYKHHVRKHVRKGKSVTDYDRGHGAQLKKQVRLKNPPTSSSNYIVHIRYTSISGEQIPVKATNPSNAIEHAMLVRKNIQSPLEVEAIKL